MIVVELSRVTSNEKTTVQWPLRRPAIIKIVPTGYTSSTAAFHRNKSFSAVPYILYNVYKSLLHGLAPHIVWLGQIDVSQCFTHRFIVMLTLHSVYILQSQLDALFSERLRWHLQGRDVSTVPLILGNSTRWRPVDSDNTFLADVTSTSRGG